MPTLTGRNTRTITGYAVSLLDYPRWIIERQVDFTNCHLTGRFDVGDKQCSRCRFGQACRWLNQNCPAPTPGAPLDELLRALDTAVEFLRSTRSDEAPHSGDCECDTCLWLHETAGFLRTNRRRR